MFKNSSNIPSGVRGFIYTALGCTALADCQAQEPVKTTKQTPNIILILADDLGYGDLSSYGATKISTPAIDQLAEEGMKFTNAYACSSLSSPSRYGLMTGRYSWRTRLQYGVLKNYEQPLIEPERTTLASLAKRNGYYTACVGKWHLGLEWQLNDKAPEDPEKNVFNSNKDNLQQYIDFSKPIGGGPTERGFDYFFGMSGSNNMQPYVFIENNKVVQAPSKKQTIPYDFMAYNVETAPDWDFRTVNQVLTHKAVDVINNHFSTNKQQPLFLYFPTSAIHRPCVPTFTKGKSQAGLRGDIVVELDWTVNEIVKALKANNAYENTVLIFTSDNGPRPGDPAIWINRYKQDNYTEYQSYFDDYAPEYVNENGNDVWKNGWLTYGHRSSGELLGFKQDPSEGGIRVPLIVHWSQQVKPATVNPHLVCTSDFLATFSDLFNDKLAQNEGEDSYSFLSNIVDSHAPQVRNTATLASGSSGALIVIKDGWKYIEPAQPGRWPETYYPNSPGDKVPRLYNLNEDISEQNNLYNSISDKLLELSEIAEKVKANTKREADKLPAMATFSVKELENKIKGGWAGQTIGVTYGGPTEFKYQESIIPDSVVIPWNDDYVRWYFDFYPGLYDDIYMDLTFVDVFERLGIDAPVDSLAYAFANADFMLWHANQAARYNILNGIMPPASGHWKNNLHSNCIDFQIEADFAGLMSPGMINSSAEICDRVGHIMNYGDGWYGGVYVAAMYSLAFVSDDIEFIVREALKVIPPESNYAKRMRQVLKWYEQYPDDWKKVWLEIENAHWEEDCPIGIHQAFNIEATVNSAYVLLGLLYGKSDFYKTIDIATRCGQDSDCNPATCAGILGTILGYNKIPEYWLSPLQKAENIPFSHTTMTLNDTYHIGFKHALQMIVQNGGNTDENNVTIKIQHPKAVRLEQNPPNRVPVKKETVGKSIRDFSSYQFTGTGLVINGKVKGDKNKFADYVANVDFRLDGKKIKSAKLPLDFIKRSTEVCWIFNLPDTEHRIQVEWLNPQEGIDIALDNVITYLEKEN